MRHKTFIMRPLLCLLALGAGFLRAEPLPENFGIVPTGCRVLTLARLPESVPAAPADVAEVRLAVSGRPVVLFRGQLVALAEQPGQAFADWLPPAGEGGTVRDFCWLDRQTLVLLRETRLEFVKDGAVVRVVLPPHPGMRIAPAGATHCYLFGGAPADAANDVWRLGLDGSAPRLFQAAQPVTAVAGDGRSTFVAVGDTVFFLAEGKAPEPIFRERSAITALVLASNNGLFYATETGVGYLAGPDTGLIFLPERAVSLDCRRDRLVLLTAAHEVRLIEPVSGFADLVTSTIATLKAANRRQP
jgi:hypothetical protein